MENKMTAVEWLEKNISLDMNPFELIEYFNKAKEMEKQQIIDSWNNCLCIQDFNDKCAEYYYNETYGKTDKSFQATRG